MSSPDNAHTFAHELTDRHIQFMAIGGAIGAALFLGSGGAIKAAGPSVLLAYSICGIVMFFMARALGEIVLNGPRAASFTVLIEEILGPWAGFVTSWSYWLVWVLVGIAEISAIGICVRFWTPSAPQWLTALCALGIPYLINRIGVGLFGEVEFWMALVKVIAIVALIIGGTFMVVLGLGPAGDPASVAHLWNDGGFFPNGLTGFLAVLPAALFSFGGSELVGMTAAEAAVPVRSVPRAINGVVARILIFYLGSLAVIMAVTRWSSLSDQQSPFVMVFQRLGLPAAAGIVNLVVLTAVLSSCNSGLYATARILFGLAERRQAPRWLYHLDRRRIPARAADVSALGILAGVGLNYVVPEKAFTYAASVVAALLLWTWLMIVVSHHVHRRRRSVGNILFPMPLYPASSITVVVFITFVAILMAITPAMRETFYVALAWFAVLTGAYQVIRLRGIKFEHRTAAPMEKSL